MQLYLVKGPGENGKPDGFHHKHPKGMSLKFSADNAVADAEADKQQAGTHR